MPVYQNSVPATCRPGDKGSAVSFLQYCLRRAGSKEQAVTGTYDAATQAAVRSLQTARAMVSDGICGAKTWGVLLNGGERIVHYAQNDSKWKSTMYSSRGDVSQTIGNSGCGPTSLAVALSAVLGATGPQPPELCKLAVSGGFRTANEGTSWGFFASAAVKNNAKATQISSIDNAIKALDAGQVVVASMGPDAYTKNGHYIALRDFDSYNGLFYTLDPISTVRNSCTRDVIAKQAKQFWAVEKAAAAIPVAPIAPPAARPDYETTLDNAAADGIIGDVVLWRGVLAGLVKPTPVQVRALIDKYHAALTAAK
jgi:hypothetical protein